MEQKPFTKRLLAICGSLRLAILLILSLAVVLTAATFYELYCGTAAAHYSIYETVWFGILLFLIALSVTCAAFKKYPWRRHQIGFLITHLGIVILIAGSFVSFQWGLDANMPLLNGEEKNYVLLDKSFLSVEALEKKMRFSKSLRLGPYLREKEIISFSPAPDTRVAVDRFLPFAGKKEEILKDDQSSREAVEIGLSNAFLNLSQWLWMNPDGYEAVAIGPAELVFRRLKNGTAVREFLKKEETRGFLGEILLKVDQKSWTLPLFSKDLKKRLVVEGSPFQVQVLAFFPDAIVEGGKLVNRSRQFNNPAIKLLLIGPKGWEKHLAFSFFPQFPSIHQKTSLYGAKLEFVSPDLKGHSNRLEIGVTPAHRFYYRVSSSEGTRTGSIKRGEAYPTGWMNLTFSVKQFYEHAIKKVDYFPVYPRDPNNSKAPSAVRFKFSRGDKIHNEWLLFREVKDVVFDDETYRISYQPETLPLDFSIHLERFEMGTDPGTDNAASYQSRVVLEDPALNLSQNHLVRMNEPLTHKGFTFYQASYQTSPEGKPIGSVLSVGYDPGRIMKYGGSVLIVIGILLMFFFRKAYLRAYQAYQEKRKAVVVTAEGETDAV